MRSCSFWRPQPVLLDAGAAVEAYAGAVLEPEAVAIAMKALRAASGRAASSAAVAASASASSIGGVDESPSASSSGATPSAAPWSYTRTRIAAYEALLTDDEASSGNIGAVIGTGVLAGSWLERDGGTASSKNEDGEDAGSRSFASQGFSRAAKIDAEVSSDALASFNVWLNERQAAAG